VGRNVSRPRAAADTHRVLQPQRERGACAVIRFIESRHDVRRRLPCASVDALRVRLPNEGVDYRIPCNLRNWEIFNYPTLSRRKQFNARARSRTVHDACALQTASFVVFLVRVLMENYGVFVFARGLPAATMAVTSVLLAQGRAQNDPSGPTNGST